MPCLQKHLHQVRHLFPDESTDSNRVQIILVNQHMPREGSAHLLCRALLVIGHLLHQLVQRLPRRGPSFLYDLDQIQLVLLLASYLARGHLTNYQAPSLPDESRVDGLHLGADGVVALVSSLWQQIPKLNWLADTVRNHQGLLRDCTRSAIACQRPFGKTPLALHVSDHSLQKRPTVYTEPQSKLNDRVFWVRNLPRQSLCEARASCQLPDRPSTQLL
mmetsp:Transcript_26095/g.69356  ORF Transcript_26095/g.69356 Transcript_26095/m.69356 type:complete len:218 (-) Transcript_26095:255-908(-)